MRILLIEPCKDPVSMGGEDLHIFEPLALEYVAAGIPSGHDVRILDMRLDKNLDNVLNEFPPDIVGITSYTVHVNIVKSLLGRIKEFDNNILTVVGGHHATVQPEDFACDAVDLIVCGEGVNTFGLIVDRHRVSETCLNIPGVAYLEDGRVKKNPPKNNFDLDGLPHPRRDLTRDYRSRYFAEWLKPIASIRTSKGCPYRCNFCALWKISGGKYYTRDPLKIVEELKGIEEPYVFFADDESLVDAKRMERLADLIIEEGINKRFFLYGRSDTIARNPGLLKKWRSAGLERVFVGLEFFRDSDLAYIRKKSTVDDNGKAIEILNSLGIQVYASFIIRPEFDREDFKLLKQYIRKLNLNFAGYAMLTPLPGTEFMDEVRDKLITDKYEYFDFVHVVLPTKLTLKQFYAEYTKLFRTAIPFSKGLNLLSKFSWKDIPRVLIMTAKWHKRAGRLYKDY